MQLGIEIRPLLRRARRKFYISPFELSQCAQTATVVADPLNLSAERAKTLIASETVTILDARDARSYRAGHIAGAVAPRRARAGFSLSGLEYDKPILVYC